MNDDLALEKLLSTKKEEEQSHLLASLGVDSISQLSKQWKDKAQQFAFQGRIEKALQVGHLMLAAGQQFHDAALKGFAQWTLANVYHIAERDTEAIAYFDLAADFYTQHNDELNLARMSIGHVAALNRAFEFERASALVARIKPILAACREPIDSIQRLAGVLNNEAIIYEQLGRYEEALHCFYKKIRLWESWPEHPACNIQIARTYNNIGYSKLLLNLLSEASFALNKAHQILSQPQFAHQHQTDLLRVKVNQARLLAHRGENAEKILDAFSETEKRRLSIQNDDVHGYQLVGHLPLFIAEWKGSKGLLISDDVQQLEHLQTVYIAANQRWEAGRVTLLLARVALANGRLQDALNQTNALRHAVAYQAEWLILYETWLLLGQIHAQAGRTTEGINAWETAISLLETIGGKIKASDLRSSFLEDKQSPYLSLAHHFLQRKAWATAFHWLERKRARTLVETFAGSHSLYPESAKTIVVRLEEIQQQRNELCDEATRKRLDHQLLALSRQLSGLIDPEYRWLTGETVAETTLANALHENAVMLIYAIVQEQIWLLPVTHEGFLPAKSLGEPISEAEIEHAIRWLEGAGNTPPEKFDKWVDQILVPVQRPLQAWYEQLIAPISEILTSKTELIIVPDGSLHQIPFHALLNREAGRYLVEETAVSYAHSASAWVAGQQRKISDTDNGLLLSFDGEQLKHTATAAETIAATKPNCIIYTEADATRDKLTSTEAKNANLIHFACHAEFRTDSPQFSYLQLADGRFEAIDLLWRSLSAELVTLSACETGKGVFQGGEYWGLARAFLLAGARSVLATHWLVDDHATAVFMKTFYQHRQTGLSIRHALRQAQLTFIQSSSRLKHPYFWAPFFTVGAEPTAPF